MNQIRELVTQGAHERHTSDKQAGEGDTDARKSWWSLRIATSMTAIAIC